MSIEVLGAVFGAGLGLGAGLGGSLILTGVLHEEGRRANITRMALASVVGSLAFALIGSQIGAQIDRV